MISVKKALSIIKNNVNLSLNTENIKSTMSIGRITAENVKALNDNPSFNMSAMDGYAVNDNPTNGIYKIIATTYAGRTTRKKLSKGQAVRVFTGSKLPEGTRAVIIQENVKKLDNKLIFNLKKKIEIGSYIRRKGLDFKKSKIIISKRKEINARDIALLVAANIKHVKVYKKPKVSLLATGDELIITSKKKIKGSVFASSLFMLENLINLSGSQCIYKKIVRDNKNIIKNTFKKVSKSDLIITTGGVSVGDKDLIRPSLKELGYKEKFWKIMMKPGKPLLFGTLNGTPIGSLPGNPVSSYVCFYIFVFPLLYKLVGIKKEILIKKAELINSVSPSSDRESYYRGYYYNKKEKLFVRALSNQDSSLLKTLSESNCLIKINKASIIRHKGNKVEILILPYLF